MFDISTTMTARRLAVAFVPLMLGIILHEVAHGWMANRRGDPTAASLGRLTLNPLPHVDPMGLLFFVLTSIASPVVLGWAKPVPVDPRNFRNITRDIMAVSAAGPASNFLLAFTSAGLLRLYVTILPYQTWNGSPVWQFFFLMLYASVSINCALAWFNLIPIPPLDGSKLLLGVLPPMWRWKYMQLERFGMVIVLLLLMIGAFQYVLSPMVTLTAELFLAVFGF